MLARTLQATRIKPGRNPITLGIMPKIVVPQNYPLVIGLIRLNGSSRNMNSYAPVKKKKGGKKKSQSIQAAKN